MIATSAFEAVRTRDGKQVRLAMESLWLKGRVLPVGARLLVAHTFRSAERVPVEVVYAFGLPRDAALRRFRIVGETFQVRSELQRVEEAREKYEEGVASGHLAALARTYRDGRVNLTVGNLRPGELVKVYLELVAGVDLTDDGLRFRFPFTLAPCYHKEARTAVPRPGMGEMDLPTGEFDDLMLPPWLTDASGLHQVGFDLSVSTPGAVTEIASPSHALSVKAVGTREARVGLAVEAAVPDRDLVLDVRAAGSQPRVYGGVMPSGKAPFTVVVPSHQFGVPVAGQRAVVFVLDRSGSMEGVPLAQATRALAACLSTLGEADRFGIVAFDDKVELLDDQLLTASREHREQAGQFIERICSRGGTELGAAVAAGIRLLNGTAGELFVLTDGQVSGTEKILALAREARVRLHCLGIGSASQDRFLTLLARQTEGVSRFASPKARVDLEALELFASTGQPIAEEIRCRWGRERTRSVGALPGSVFAGRPLIAMGEGQAAGPGRITLSWRTGGEAQRWSMEMTLEPGPDAELVWLLQGARLLTDLDAELDGELGQTLRARRQAERVQRKLEEVGLRYGLASRALSLVAIVERPGDDASQVPKTLVVPVGLPDGLEPEAYFRGPLYSRAAGTAGILATEFLACGADQRSLPGARTYCSLGPFRAEDAAPEPDQAETRLVTIVALLEADGGMPGPDLETRVLRSLLLLIALMASEHGVKGGPFRQHGKRLLAYLSAAGPQLREPAPRQLVAELASRASRGDTLSPDLVEWALEEARDCPASVGAWADVTGRVSKASSAGGG